MYNRAMAMFINKSPNSRLFYAPDSYHEVLFENEYIRGAVYKTVIDFFSQLSDSVLEVNPSTPLIECDKSTPIFSPVESLVRVVGVTLAIGGFLTGVALILSGGRK